jgi:hypothetical protein
MDSVRDVVLPGIGRVYLNVQPHFLTISEELKDTYSFDSEGRFIMGFLDGINYKRGLEHAILKIAFSSDRRTKTRQFLTDDESRHIIDGVRARVGRIASTLPASEQADIRGWLARILAWDADRLRSERNTFQSIYRPISILPPDQYLSVVLQAAEGCSWNRCTFCTFYRDRRFRIKSPAEFRQHIGQIKAFFGGALGLRKSIFLADANALIIPQPRLIELLRIIHEEFPVGEPRAGEAYTLRGIYSFLDIFGAEQKSYEDYCELREYGVRRVYIGLETGDDEVFTLLNKPGSPRECIEAVQTIKAAGIDVGVILLAGAGGDRLAPQHVQHSLDALARMGLEAGDIIYLSPLIVSGEDEYSQRLREQGARPLERAEIMQQVDSIKAALKTTASPRPRVTLYNIEEFVY